VTWNGAGGCVIFSHSRQAEPCGWTTLIGSKASGDRESSAGSTCRVGATARIGGHRIKDASCGTARARTNWAESSRSRSSVAINLLYLASPLFMLQVYDRVISSASALSNASLRPLAGLPELC
jgi:hypothetical protein